jgi:hypothetical protein
MWVIAEKIPTLTGRVCEKSGSNDFKDGILASSKS